MGVDEVKKEEVVKAVEAVELEIEATNEEIEQAEQDFQKTASALTGFDKDVFATQEELDTGMRFFEAEYNDVNIKLSVRRPTNDEITKGEWEYSKYFNKAVLEGIAPEAAVLAALNENGCWTNEDEQEIESLAENLADLEIELNIIDKETRDYKKLADVRLQLKETRAKLQEKRVEKQSYLSHTAQQKCEEQKTRVIVSLVTEYASGPKKGLNLFEDHYKTAMKKTVPKNSKLIPSFEALQAFEDQNFVITCYINYLTLINGLASDFLDRQMPEDKEFDWESEVVEEKTTKKKATKKVAAKKVAEKKD